MTMMIRITEDMIEKMGRVLFGERPLTPARRASLLDAAEVMITIVERNYVVGLKPDLGPGDHAFVRHSDPNFGSYFGGGCAHETNEVMCGWSEQSHRKRAQS